MLGKLRREKMRQRTRGASPATVPVDLHRMVATKLWAIPCWLSFRANFIAHHYNQPLYEWIDVREIMWERAQTTDVA